MYMHSGNTFFLLDLKCDLFFFKWAAANLRSQVFDPDIPSTTPELLPGRDMSEIK